MQSARLPAAGLRRKGDRQAQTGEPGGEMFGLTSHFAAPGCRFLPSGLLLIITVYVREDRRVVEMAASDCSTPQATSVVMGEGVWSPIC